MLADNALASSHLCIARTCVVTGRSDAAAQLGGRAHPERVPRAEDARRDAGTWRMPTAVGWGRGREVGWWGMMCGHAGEDRATGCRRAHPPFTPSIFTPSIHIIARRDAGERAARVARPLPQSARLDGGAAARVHRRGAGERSPSPPPSPLSPTPFFRLICASLLTRDRHFRAIALSVYGRRASTTSGPRARAPAERGGSASSVDPECIGRVVAFEPRLYPSCCAWWRSSTRASAMCPGAPAYVFPRPSSAARVPRAGRTIPPPRLAAPCTCGMWHVIVMEVT